MSRCVYSQHKKIAPSRAELCDSTSRDKFSLTCYLIKLEFRLNEHLAHDSFHLEGAERGGTE